MTYDEFCAKFTRFDYIAIDRDGEVYGYCDEKPKIYRNRWQIQNRDELTLLLTGDVAELILTNVPEWTQSLRKL